MKTLHQIFCLLSFILASGCSDSRERIVSLRDTDQNLPVTAKSLSFSYSRNRLILSPGIVDSVKVTLSSTNEIRVRIPNASTWIYVDLDGTASGHLINSIGPDDIRYGGTIRLNRPRTKNTKTTPSPYVLVIKKP